MAPRTGEFDLIARYFAPLAAGEPGALGLLDDAAVLTTAPGRRLVVTTDAMVEGVHFPADTPPEDIAAKLLRVNLSDLAAMGARPERYTVAAALPQAIDEAWIAAFARGLGEDQDHFDVTLVGGDTVSTPGPLTLTLTALGSVEEGKPLTRAGAQTGDDIWVSGTIGDAALGLQALDGRLANLSEDDRAFLVQRLYRPEPRIALGMALAEADLVTAAADVSDGLVADLGHICVSSGREAVLEADQVPQSPAAKRATATLDDGLEHRLIGGDDYELLFTAPPAARDPVSALAEETGTRVTRIGHVRSMSKAPSVRVLDADGRRLSLERTGYRHF